MGSTHVSTGFCCVRVTDLALVWLIYLYENINNKLVFLLTLLLLSFGFFAKKLNIEKTKFLKL